jgi:hypothetical protein
MARRRVLGMELDEIDRRIESALRRVLGQYVMLPAQEIACQNEGDQKTTAPVSSGRPGSRRRTATGSRRWTREQMEAEADAMIDTFRR